MKQEYHFTPSERDLAEMSLRISSLKERAKKSKIAAKDSFHTQIRAVEDQFDLIIARLNRITQKADMASAEMKSGLSEAWTSLKVSFDSASKQLH